MMIKSERLDDLDRRLEGTVTKWSRRKLLTIRTVLLIAVATLSTFGAIGLGHLHGAISSRGVEVALQLNGLSVMSEAQLVRTVTSNHLTIYWAGPRNDFEYLLNASNPSAIVLTFLPKDRPPKAIRATYAQIVTYKVVNAFAAVLAGGGNPDVKGVVMPSGNSIFYTNADPDLVYVGIHDKDIELQVFDPSKRLWLYLLDDPRRLGPIS